MRTFDQIIDANMTVTDHLLRDAIHAVIVDAIHEAGEHEREACARLLERDIDLRGLIHDPVWAKFTVDLLINCAKLIRARGEQ